MRDFGLVQNSPGTHDMAVVAGDFAADEGLYTAVVLSLATHKRASPTDAVAKRTGTVRGWCLGRVLSEDKEPGSHLWLYRPQTLAPGTSIDIQRAARAALAWLEEDGVVLNVGVFVTRIDRRGFQLRVELTKTIGTPLSFEFSSFWEQNDAL